MSWAPPLSLFIRISCCPKIQVYQKASNPKSRGHDLSNRLVIKNLLNLGWVFIKHKLCPCCLRLIIQFTTRIIILSLKQYVNSDLHPFVWLFCGSKRYFDARSHC
ncbi:hypothetical protein NBRC111894_3306 [Sporolactobacillus inulinus]|uniref:Uncharacterized protein n=1 Tax=Sporolactobacillus inulinus TaxID=2078 RepID=A0A4Y1ZEY6_9BACL|nr:hypothetical protein NBRC111894_3306 [Sporolactobacillus inulinus]